VLLLAEGDIIALMGGDVTPGACYELERLQSDGSFTTSSHRVDSYTNINLSTNSTINESTQDEGSIDPQCMRGWKVGKLILAGEKIHIRHPNDLPVHQSQRGHHHHHHHHSSSGLNHRRGGLSKSSKSSISNLSSFRKNDTSFSIFTDSNKDSDINTDENTTIDNNIHHVDSPYVSYDLNHDKTHHNHDHHDQHPSNNPDKIKQHSADSSSGFNDRHRTLSPESIEILNLSGDVRCFRLAETPIAAFLQQTIFTSQQKSSSRKIDKDIDYHHHHHHHPIAPLSPLPIGSSTVTYQTVSTINSGIDDRTGQQSSFVRQLFTSIITTENMRVKIIVTFITACCVILRLPLLRSHYGEVTTVDDWLIAVLLPIATTLMFSLSIACPIALVIAEAVVTADLLASTEVTLLSNLKPLKDIALIDSSSVMNADGDVHALFGSLHSNSGGSGGVDGKSDVVEDDMEEGHSSMEAPPQADEFLDEDIDERAEEIADEVSTKVHWSRYFYYMIRTIQQRLFLVFSARGSDRSSSSSSSIGGGGINQYYLPIPLASTRLLEVLGAVTMVCFIDDDVICEGYSVTEEIFLLMDNHNESNNNYEESHKHKPIIALSSQQNGNNNYQGNNNNNNPNLHFNSMHSINNSNDNGTDADDGTDTFNSHHNRNKVITTGTIKTGGTFASVKGMVLDLHANPEATGSRFENPLWWRYLPRS